MQTDDNVPESPLLTNPEPRQRPPRSVITALLGLLLLVNLATSLYQLPLNRVIERRLCRDYYAQHDPSVIHQPDGSVREELCKIDVVQQGLGWMIGLMDTLWVVGDFVMTIPISFLADRYGRRTILWLNLVPRIFMLGWAVLAGYFDQALPTKAIIFGPALSFLGGDCVFNSITYSLAAGSTDDYVLRASYFGYMSSVSYVVNLLGPALASLGMTALLWLPFWIGIALLLTAVPVIRLLPDNPHSQATKRDGGEQTQPLLSSPLLKAQQDRQDTSALWTSVLQRFRALLTVPATHPRNFTLLLTTFFLTSLASSDTKLLVQYISKRYQGWTFAAAGYLISGKAVVNFTLLTVVIPYALRLFASSSADRINMRFANACFLVSVLGAGGIALAAKIWILVPGLFVYALGSALPIFTLSLLKSPSITGPREVEDEHENIASGRDSQEVENHIFSIVMLVKTLGSLIGAPLMAFLWVWGIGLGGFALGMPFFVSAALYVVATLVFDQIKVTT